VSHLQRTLKTQCSGKYKKLLGFFWTTLKTLAPRTPVKLLRVCTNTHDTLTWTLPNPWGRWHQEPQQSCYVCVPINTTNYSGLSTTLEDESTILSQNARKRHPCHTASYLVRLESLTLMCKVYNSLLSRRLNSIKFSPANGRTRWFNAE
jgi:hypothetical protein